MRCFRLLQSHLLTWWFKLYMCSGARLLSDLVFRPNAGRFPQEKIKTLPSLSCRWKKQCCCPCVQIRSSSQGVCCGPVWLKLYTFSAHVLYSGWWASATVTEQLLVGCTKSAEQGGCRCAGAAKWCYVVFLERLVRVAHYLHCLLSPGLFEDYNMKIVK